MPRYEYVCAGCGQEIVVKMSIKAYDLESGRVLFHSPPCLGQLKRKFGNFYFKGDFR